MDTEPKLYLGRVDTCTRESGVGNSCIMSRPAFARPPPPLTDPNSHFLLYVLNKMSHGPATADQTA